MALTDHEREILQQMEAQFRSADPDLVDSLRASTSPVRRRVPARVWALTVFFLLAGLVLLVVGVSVPHQLVSVAVALAGFALMVAGVALPFSRLAKPRKSLAGATKKHGSFMERQRQQWDKRNYR